MQASSSTQPAIVCALPSAVTLPGCRPCLHVPLGRLTGAALVGQQLCDRVPMPLHKTTAVTCKQHGPFRPSLGARGVVTFKHPEWWSATHEGHARLPLLFSLGGQLVLHPTIAETPDGLIVEANSYTVRRCMPAGGSASGRAQVSEQAVLRDRQAPLQNSPGRRGHACGGQVPAAT